LRGGIPNKIVLFAYNQIFWPLPNFWAGCAIVSTSLINCKLTDFSALSLKLLLFILYTSLLPNHINNEVNKRKPDKSASL